MYRDSASGAIIYTSEDVLLFRESPFACWMERLCLEQPDHGAQPDASPPGAAGRGGSREERWSAARPLAWQEFLDDLESGALAAPPDPPPVCDVADFAAGAAVVVARNASEAQRRTATLRAMREGAESIACGRIAVGPLSCSPDLLLRTAGSSDLGHHLYLPCAVRAGGAGQAPFHLSCAADLLLSLQGALPPQLLLLDDAGEMNAMNTADHLEVYRAVKKRFLAAQLGFRADAMPDPVESAHFGRWSGYAAELLKRRARAGGERRTVAGGLVSLPAAARPAGTAQRYEVAG